MSQHVERRPSAVAVRRCRSDACLSDGTVPADRHDDRAPPRRNPEREPFPVLIGLK
jgi:hypothetical protein